MEIVLLEVADLMYGEQIWECQRKSRNRNVIELGPYCRT